MKKFRGLKVFLLCVLVLILTYLLMWLDVQPILNYVEDAITGEIPVSELEDSPLWHYTRFIEREGTVLVDFSYKYQFVLHNWNTGYIVIDYSAEGLDMNGNLTIGSNSLELLKIRKINGIWEIVEVENFDIGGLNAFITYLFSDSKK